MTFHNIHQSKTVRGVIIGLCAAAVLFGTFELGAAVGYHKARFSENFGNNFRANFVGPRGGLFSPGRFSTLPMPGGHGAFGEVVSAALPTLIVAGRDNLEQTVLVNEATLIRHFRDAVGAEDIQAGDFVVVLGSPNEEGQIVAKLIRILPPPLELSPEFNNQR